MQRSRRTILAARTVVRRAWVVAALAFVALVLLTQKPWQGWNELQQTEWIMVGVGGLLVGMIQKRGKDYWPANTLLGLSVGAPSVMYVGLTQLYFRNDIEGFRVWAAVNHLGLWAWGASLLLLAWALILVIRVNTARAGGSMDLGGHAHPPTEEQTIEAAHVMNRAVRHDLGNLLMRPEFAEMLRYIRQGGTITRGDPSRDDTREP